jgi:excisionase family DNA binding protein
MSRQKHTAVEADEGGRLLITVDEAARRLSIGRSHLYGHLLRGTLRSIRIGRSRRISSSDLEAFIEELMQDSADISPAVGSQAPARAVKTTYHQPRRRR